MRLDDFGANVTSQFGEDGMIAHVFEQIGEQSRFCVEFGAADGRTCSNTWWLRWHKWDALLIEADVELAAKLRPTKRVSCVQDFVTPDNLNHYIGGRPVDFMSIDVDGDDYAIFEGLEVRPRLVCIEYNASIPPHISLRQAELGEYFGASARALVELASAKGYELIGVTKGNLLLVRDDEAHHFTNYERDLSTLFDSTGLSYLATDYGGRPIVVGAAPPWGLLPIPFIGATVGDPATLSTLRAADLREAFEAKYGPATFFCQDFGYSIQNPGPDHAAELIRKLKRRGLFIIDISNHALDADFTWIVNAASSAGYAASVVPSGVIALFPRSPT
jgi:hypothetical protein